MTWVEHFWVECFWVECFDGCVGERASPGLAFEDVVVQLMLHRVAPAMTGVFFGDNAFEFGAPVEQGRKPLCDTAQG
jgi:hypothetical protein